jgi:hypothetical protein
VTTGLSQYLDSIREHLRLDDDSEREVIDELQTHIEEEYQEMRDAGLSDEEATSTCIRLLGSARMVARQIYEAHSQGTWKQALLASMPHMLFAVLFALNWWQGIGWVAATLGVVFGIAVYGWVHGKPVWLFSWLGYYFLPVLVAGVLLLYLPRGFSWIAIIFYLPLVAWFVWAVTVKAMGSDWLYCALMMLPVPILVGWFLAAAKEGDLLRLNLEYLGYFAPGIGLTFLALAVTVAAFIRLRQRWIKLVLLPLSGILTLGMVAFYSQGRLSLPTFITLILIMAGLLLIPAIAERRIRSMNQQEKY